MASSGRDERELLRREARMDGDDDDDGAADEDCSSE